MNSLFLVLFSLFRMGLESSISNSKIFIFNTDTVFTSNRETVFVSYSRDLNFFTLSLGKNYGSIAYNYENGVFTSYGSFMKDSSVLLWEKRGIEFTYGGKYGIDSKEPVFSFTLNSTTNIKIQSLLGSSRFKAGVFGEIDNNEDYFLKGFTFDLLNVQNYVSLLLNSQLPKNFSIP